MKFGAMQQVLGKPLPDVFGLAAELGFDGVELDWFRLDEADTGGPLGPDARDAIRSAARAAGVEIPSICAHFLNQGGPASADADTARRGVEAVRTGIRLCQDLGASVLLVPFFFKGAIEGKPGIERLADNLQSLVVEAELAGVRLAVESTLPADEAVALVDAAGSPYVGVYFDMANGMGLGYDPVQEIGTLGRRIVQVHAKEFQAGDGPAGSRAAPRFDRLNAQPFGQGDVPVGQVIEALRKIDYDGYIVLETSAFDDAAASARAALAALQSFVEPRAL